MTPPRTRTPYSPIVRRVLGGALTLFVGVGAWLGFGPGNTKVLSAQLALHIQIECSLASDAWCTELIEKDGAPSVEITNETAFIQFDSAMDRAPEGQQACANIAALTLDARTGKSIGPIASIVVVANGQDLARCDVPETPAAQ